MKKTLYVNRILLEFVSEEPIDSDTKMETLIEDAVSGDLSMITFDKVVNKPVKGMRAVKVLDEHGTDYEFFGMDKFGNELEY